MSPGLDAFPFSRRGSWISVFRKKVGAAGGDPRAPISLRVVAGILWEEADILDLHLECDARPVACLESLRPELLTLRGAEGAGLVQMAFQDEHTLRLRVDDATLRLDFRREKPMRLGREGWGVRAGSCGWLLFSVVSGDLSVGEIEGKWTLRFNGEILIHRTSSGGVPPQPLGTLEDCASATLQDFRQWTAGYPAGPGEFFALRERELWTVWNLIVHPLGNFRREVVLVSKGTLVGLWSWDHCWHMLGTASVDPRLAWNNFLALFDHQDSEGALPDVMSANGLLRGILKPPVHGWMLGLLESRHDWFDDEHRREIYPAMVRFTEFWFRGRDEDGDGIPHYLDGCDSGWDNATVFDAGFPIETPDLATWLVLQLEWLAHTARQLGLENDAENWEKNARTTLARLLEHFWTGERFVARMSGTHEEVRSESLLLRIPLILGDRLPPEARAWCLDGLTRGGRYRAPFGLLTEPSDSPLFEGDGYWRGPMWPVAVFIFVEAFRANGLPDEAEALMRDYLCHVETAGNFENYRGDNGAGVRDTAIAWTATCALCFLTELR